MKKIVILDDRYSSYCIEEKILEGWHIVTSPAREEEELIALTADADALLVNLCPLGKEVIGKLRRCRVIARYGVGYDNVDIKAAEEQGIWVTNVPDYCVEDVSDHVIALMFSLNRKLLQADRGVRAGKWDFCPSITRVRNKTLGIIGFGYTGRGVYKKTRGLGLGRTLVFDRTPAKPEKVLLGPEFTSLETLLKESDWITIHVPLTPETDGLIGKEELELMKPGAFLINTSRGGVIHQGALTRFLERGKIGGAGLDVFENEPLAHKSPLMKLPNVILTPHMAYYSREALIDLKTKAARNVREVLEGRPPLTPVNTIIPEPLKTGAEIRRI